MIILYNITTKMSMAIVIIQCYNIDFYYFPKGRFLF